MTARLLNIDPYGGSSFIGGPSRVFDTPRTVPVNTHHDQQLVGPPPHASPLFIERTLELPSWERLGRLLIDIWTSIIVGRNHSSAPPPPAAVPALLRASTSKHAEGENSPTVTSVVAAAAAAVAAGVPVHSSGGAGRDAGASSAEAASAEVAPPHLSPPMTLSTPVRIVLRGHDEAEAVERPVAGTAALARPASLGGGGDPMTVEAARPAAGAGATAAGRGSEEQRYGEQQQQQEHRRLRRPSVERAMELYSDGSSSSDDEGEEGNERRGKGKGRKRGNGGRPPESAERRTSARRQKQDEIREAHVAAAREDNIEVRTPRVLFRCHLVRPPYDVQLQSLLYMMLPGTGFRVGTINYHCT